MTPSRSHARGKRARESPALQQRPSSSKRRLTPREAYSGPRRREESPLQSRTPLLPHPFHPSQMSRPDIGGGGGEDDDDDDDEVHTRDRIVLLPTRRARDMSRSRMVQDASTLDHVRLPPDSSYGALSAAEMQQQQQQEANYIELAKQIVQIINDAKDEVEDEVQDDPQDDFQDGFQDEVQEGLQDDLQDGFQDDVLDDPQQSFQDDVQYEMQDDPHEDLQDEFLDDVQDEVQDDEEDDVEDDEQDDWQGDLQEDMQDVVQSEIQDDVLDTSSSEGGNDGEGKGFPVDEWNDREAPFNEPSSPTHGSESLLEIPLPMESTPFPLSKKVSKRKSTPHPAKEWKVRASLAALNSPHSAQRIRRREDEVVAAYSKRLFSSSPSSKLGPGPGARESHHPQERELSPVFALEQDAESEDDDDDDLPPFPVEPSRVDLPLQARERWVEESEEIDADDFVYETVVMSDNHQPEVMVQTELDKDDYAAQERTEADVVAHTPLDSLLVDTDGSTTMSNSVRERARMLSARAGMVEISSLNREAAARATAILKLNHSYVQFGMMDTELEEEAGEMSLSRSRHRGSSSLRQIALANQMARQTSPDRTELDKTLDDILLEKENEIRRLIASRRSPAVASATPKTPSLPGAFPSNTPASKLHLSADQVVSKAHQRLPRRTSTDHNQFSTRSWQALDALVKAEILAAANHLRLSSGTDKGEALLQAASDLNKAGIVDAFLRSYGLAHTEAEGNDMGEWSSAKVQSRVVALVRSFLLRLRVKYPELQVDVELSNIGSKSRGDVPVSAAKAVDESGVTEASLHLPFEMVLESTPAPRRHAPKSPILGEQRSKTVNIYPTLPSPPRRAATQTATSPMVHDDTQRPHKPAPAAVEPASIGGDTSVGLMGLASRSLGFVYATFGLGRAKEAEVTTQRQRQTSVRKERDQARNTAPARHMSTLSGPSSSTMLQAPTTTTFFDQSQSMSAYRSGSTRLIQSGASSTVDPTALALLSPHTHALAKTKMQELKQSREARKWRSPRAGRLPGHDSSIASSLSRSR